ncbi:MULTISPECIES: Ig-like domain-containing protein [unclassified Exiguobacterium]|uniref:Ig-like domain-containing protein n=2 Tax=Exiguobacterium TaxID=33986 RepID=UPI00103DE494|nr:MULTISPECIES: Ig-like domain-containing protein [unclassified Exiguobacterium]TCI66803.1 hypothetical protein EVJ19_14315 [Exiguobacterium sp. IPCI3]TCI76259.1 hypothetical protein EVJ18_14300 [Exiguobacterium sp. IPCH1]TCI77470.1 hypothetical protein EVJ17_14300 [Exiguobacterium sp. IPBC4]
MKKFYTYVLVSLIIFTSLSISPETVKADDGIGPKVVDVRLDQSTITKGQKVSLYISAEDKDGLYSTGELEVVTPSGDKKIVTVNVQHNQYTYNFDFQSSFWRDEEYGVYQLNAVTLFDGYGNQAKTILNKQFEVLNDTNAPVVNKIVLSQKTLFATREEFLKIDIEVNEIGLPQNKAIIYFKHKKSGQEKSINISFDYEKNIYSTKAYGWENNIFGEWEIDRIQLSDVAGNSETQFGPFLGDSSITLLNPEDDTVSPDLVSTSFLIQTFGSTVIDTIKVEAKDNAYIDSISVTVNHRITGKTVTLTKGHADFLPMQVSSGEKVTAHFSIELYEVLDNLGGYWDISEIEIIDRKQNKTIIRERINSVYIDKPISDLGVRVISKNTTLSDTVISQPVFILPNVTLSIFSNVRISGDVYNLGSIRSFGGLTVFGTLNAKNISLGHNPSISNGEIQVIGSNYFSNRNLTEQVNFVLPLNTNGGLLNNGDGTFDIAGLTLPFSNKIRINGVETTLDENGKFKAFNIPVNAEGSALIQINAMNGLTYSRNIKVYGNERPIATTSKDSGIYLSGTQINFTSSKEGTVYYDAAYNSEYYGMYRPFNSDFVLNNDIKVKYYSIDPTGIKSEVDEKKYRVFSVYSPKASESFIQGSGSSGLKIQAEIDKKNYTTTIDSKGHFLIEGLDLKEAKNIKVFAMDDEYTSELYTVDVVNDMPIVIKGAEDQKVYNRDVTITYNKGELYLSGVHFVASGTIFTEDGYYELNGQDSFGHYANISFTIDKTAPQVSGIQTGKAYKQATYPIFTEGTATLNGVNYMSGTKIDQEGEYILVITDQAGNKTTLYFAIDYKAPIILDIDNGKIYNRHVTPVFLEGTGLLNGKPYVSGTPITTDGEYELTVSDRAGNKTVIRFKVDQKPVTVTGVETGKTYQRVTPLFSEGDAVLNGVPFKSGTVINQSGAYVLLVTDEAGNETKLTFIVDGTAPTVTGFIEGIHNYQEVSPTFTEGTGTLNGKPFVSGTKVMQEGKYVLRVTDQIGNETVIPFTIDRTAPIVTGVKSKQLTNQSVVIQYNEGTAMLNGKRILNNWSVSTSGNYTLRVADQAGNLTVLTFTIDKVAPSKPSISTLTNKSTKVTGKAEKGSMVSITYNGRTYTTKASTAGTYSYSLKTTKAGATLTVRAKDAAGNLSTTASSKVLNTFATFTVNTVKSSATSVTGKGNKAATVQAFVGTKAISKTAKVDSKGNYKLTIPRQKAGATVTVKMTQTGYQELKKMTKVIK